MNMVDVIAEGAARSARLKEGHKVCPWCGELPPLATKQSGYFLVACENEDCPCQPQVSGNTLDLAWARWNRRAA